jgi:hypothetical protein
MQHNKISKFPFFFLHFKTNYVNKFSIEILSFLLSNPKINKNFRQFFQLHPVKCDKLSHIKQHRTQNSLFLLIIFWPQKIYVYTRFKFRLKTFNVAFFFVAKKMSQKEAGKKLFWFFFDILIY